MTWLTIIEIIQQETSSLTQYTKAKYLQTVIEHSESHRVDVAPTRHARVSKLSERNLSTTMKTRFQTDFYRACKLWETINSMTSKRMCTDNFQKGMKLQKRSHEISDIESQVQETFRWTTNWIEISISDVFVTNLLINTHWSFSRSIRSHMIVFPEVSFLRVFFSSLRSDMFHIKRIFFPNSWVTLVILNRDPLDRRVKDSSIHRVSSRDNAFRKMYCENIGTERKMSAQIFKDDSI